MLNEKSKEFRIWGESWCTLGRFQKEGIIRVGLGEMDMNVFGHWNEGRAFQSGEIVELRQH